MATFGNKIMDELFHQKGKSGVEKLIKSQLNIVEELQQESDGFIDRRDNSQQY